MENQDTPQQPNGLSNGPETNNDQSPVVSHGGMRVIQPTEEIKRAVQEQQANSPTVSPPTHTDTQQQSVAQPFKSSQTLMDEQVYRDKPSKAFYKKPIFMVALVFCVLVTATGAGLFLKGHQSPAKSATRSGPQRKSKTPTAFEQKLAQYPKYLSALHAFTLPVYVPRDGTLQATVIGAHTEAGVKKQFIYYGINLQSGQGLVPGSYEISEFTRDSSFQPSNDCGLPLGGRAASPITCTAYQGATKEMPAYVYQGQQPGNITNTSVPQSSYLTLYVQRDEEIITIQTSGSSPEELYEMVKDMELINPVDLPVDTTVSFE